MALDDKSPYTEYIGKILLEEVQKAQPLETAPPDYKAMYIEAKNDIIRILKDKIKKL